MAISFMHAIALDPLSSRRIANFRTMIPTCIQKRESPQCHPGGMPVLEGVVLLSPVSTSKNRFVF